MNYTKIDDFYIRALRICMDELAGNVQHFESKSRDLQIRETYEDVCRRIMARQESIDRDLDQILQNTTLKAQKDFARDRKENHNLSAYLKGLAWAILLEEGRHHDIAVQLAEAMIADAEKSEPVDPHGDLWK